MSNPDPKELSQDDRCTQDSLKVFLKEENLESYPHLLTAFDYPEMRCVYVNTTGHVLLSPCNEERLEGTFTLRDIIALEEKDRFDSSVFPMFKIMNRWEGELGLRDLWGSGIRAAVELVSLASDCSPGGKLICLKAEPIGAKRFEELSGWKDRELLAALLGNGEDVVYFKDKQSRFIRASKVLTKRFGLEHPHQVIGRTDWDFFESDHAAVAYDDEQRVLKTGEPIFDKIEKEVWPDKTETWVSSSKLPLRDSKGNIIGTFGISRDITRRKDHEKKQKELETKLLLAQRLEAIGSLAAGVAHEINTPTQYVADNVGFLTTSFEDLAEYFKAVDTLVSKIETLPEFKEDLEQFRKVQEEVDLEFICDEIPDTLSQSADGLKKIARIVRSLKEFSYPTQPGKTKTDLNRAIENTVTVSRGEWKHIAKMSMELDPDLPEVECVVDEINQVILNLIVNAAHAIEESGSVLGEITIRTKSMDDSVCIEITDTGTGIPEDARDRLFEPFFTTKEVGKGTGQGLTMARNVVVKSHCGRIEFDSTMGEGTTFSVWLPVTQKENCDVALSEGEVMQ